MKGQPAFDFILGSNKLYNPIEGDKYSKPNGLSFRPLGVNLAEYLDNFQGQVIIELSKDLILPDQFVMIHENNDHYSLQTTKPIKPSEFCKLAEILFNSQKLLTKAELSVKVISYFKKWLDKTNVNLIRINFYNKIFHKYLFLEALSDNYLEAQYLRWYLSK